MCDAEKIQHHSLQYCLLTLAKPLEAAAIQLFHLWVRPVLPTCAISGEVSGCNCSAVFDLCRDQILEFRLVVCWKTKKQKR